MSKPLRQSRTDHWSRGQDREDALRHASPAGVRNFLLRRVASRRPGRGGGARFPFGFPNEPIGNIPIWTFDPNHPDGLNQPGTIVGENCLGPDDVTQSLAIVNTTFGKALAFTQFASIRRSITNWQPIVSGPHAGWTQITAPGFGAAYPSCWYRHNNPRAAYPGLLNVFGLSGALGAAMGDFARVYTNGYPQFFPDVLDNDNVAVPFDTSGLPAYSGGGTLGMDGGIGTAQIYPAANAELPVCTLYNTRMYLGVRHMVPVGYPLNRVAGSKQFFGIWPTFANSGCYGPLGGTAGDNQTPETTGTLGIAWGWSSGNEIGGAGGNSRIGGGFTDGHFAYDWANTERPDYLIRGVPIDYEILLDGDSEGNTDAVAKMWFNRTAPGSPDYIRTGFSFSDGNWGFGGFGPRGGCLTELANTDGGGGNLPDVPKVTLFYGFKLSGGYVRPGEQPNRWEGSIIDPDPGGAVPRTVRAIFALKDAKDGAVRAPVNNTHNHAAAPFGDPNQDVQFDATNGGVWAFAPGTCSDADPIVGEVLHASTVPGASYDTAKEGPIISYTVKFGGVAGVEGVDFSVTNPTSQTNTPLPATINILPGTVLSGAVTIDYRGIGHEFLQAGKIGVDVVIQAGHTDISIQSIGRANNNIRYGSYIGGSVGVDA